MDHTDDDRMLEELSRMAHVYFSRGNFELAKKCQELATSVRQRITREKVVNMSEWAESHSNDEKEA